MLTLNQHIQLFSNFQSAHRQLKTFYFGDVWEWYETNKDTGRLIYPAMFATCTGGGVNGHQHTRNYTIFFADLERHAEQNENEVLSDMELIALDFLSYMQKGEENAQNILQGVTLTPFTERGVDYIAGYELTFSIVQDFEYPECTIPMSGNPSQISTCPSVLIYNTDTNETVTTVASGGSYGVLVVSIISGGAANTTFTNTVIAS